MKVKSLILMLALALASLVVFPVQIRAASNNFYIAPSPVVGSPGAEVTLSVKLDSVTDLYAYEFILRWDNTLLKFKSITNIWMKTVADTDFEYSVPTTGQQVMVYEGFTDASQTASGTDVTLVNITLEVLAGGICDLNFTEHYLWTTNMVEISSTATNSSFLTHEPYVTFTWTPDYPEAGETVTFNATGCFDPDGAGISEPDGYQWYIDGSSAGTGVTITHTFASYSKTAHNITLLVTDNGGQSYALTKWLKIDRDLSIFTIWPSKEDFMGSINKSIDAGKWVVVMVRLANIGTILEDPSTYPPDAAVQLWLTDENGNEIELLKSWTGAGIGPSPPYYPGESWSKWYFWDTYGYDPGTYKLKANMTVLPGETDASNNELWFGPFNITEGFPHDVRIDGIWTYDNVDYVNGYYYTVGQIANITVCVSNVGTANVSESVIIHVYKDGVELPSWPQTITLEGGELYREITVPWFTFPGDTNIDGVVDSLDLGAMGTAWGKFEGEPGYRLACDLYWDGVVDSADLGTMGTTWGKFADEVTPPGVYELDVVVEAVSGETALWAVWDNNLVDITGYPFFFGYDYWELVLP